MVSCAAMLTFAIVIPNLDQSHFLSSALESLRHQSAPFQLAVMDGGSKDNFSEVIEGYSDMITFLRSGPDDGQAAAIREGEDRVAGDIFSWLNADDYYFPGALDKVATFFERDPELDVVYGDAVHVTKEGFFQSYFPLIQSFRAKDLGRFNFICQPSCFVRRSAYEAVGGIDPGLRYTMDWDLWCRLSLAGARFKYIHEPLAAVRYYPGTKTLSSDWGRYKEIWRIETKYSHRVLPFSWAGFYHYHIFSKEKKKATEKILLNILDCLRDAKKRLFSGLGLTNSADRSIYGFHRWGPIVEGSCTIHLPWYDKRQWKTLCLTVDPVDSSYRIQINGRASEYVLGDNSGLRIRAPQLTEAYRSITIERPERDRWRFLGFSCDLDQDNVG